MEVHGVGTIDKVEMAHINGFYATIRKPKSELIECSSPAVRHQKGYSATTVALMGTDLRAVFNWLLLQVENRKQVLDFNPMKGAAKPKRDTTVLPPYEQHEIEKLLEACSGNQPLRVRDKALILMFLDTAIRLEGMSKLKIMDVNMEANTVTYDPKGGGQPQTAYFSSITKRALAKYLALAGMADKTHEDPLWWGKRGALTYYGISEVIQKIGSRAGVHGECHKLRRTAAITMLRQGASLEDVRELLSHADYQCIRRYLKYLDEDLKRAHDKHSPVMAMVQPAPKRGIGKRTKNASAPSDVMRKLS